MRFIYALSALAWVAHAAALVIQVGGQNMVVERDSDGLQDIVSLG
jgi:hypothetical protein